MIDKRQQHVIRTICALTGAHTVGGHKDWSVMRRLTWRKPVKGAWARSEVCRRMHGQWAVFWREREVKRYERMENVVAGEQTGRSWIQGKTGTTRPRGLKVTLGIWKVMRRDLTKSPSKKVPLDRKQRTDHQACRAGPSSMAATSNWSLKMQLVQLGIDFLVFTFNSF